MISNDKNEDFCERARKQWAHDCRDAGVSATQDAKAERRSVYKIHEYASTLLTKLSRAGFCSCKIGIAYIPVHKRAIFYASLLCGLWFVGNATYIHAKAILAQFLLETAWTETGSGQQEVKPWPWADTWPVARLSVPRLGINHIVLAGASGASLAFGPGHLFNSAQPGEPGNVIISGHRDTHFAFLKQLQAGDQVLLEGRDKSRLAYQVTEIRIVDQRQTPTISTDTENKLMLITCYPFEAIRAGGPLRYLVIAETQPGLMT